jgi:hypothetical protein
VGQPPYSNDITCHITLWADILRYRKSKIKCINEGTAPCQKCRKSRIPGCELSRPPNKTPRKAIRRDRLDTPGRRSVNEHENESPVPSSTATSPARVAQDLQPSTQKFAHDDGDLSQTDRHLTGLSTDLVLKSLNVFVNKYPELAILHLPSFAKKHQSQDTKEIKTLLAALLAITRSHPLLITFPWESSLLPKERYAEYARDRLSRSSFEAPRLEVAQALLIMTVYEWGTREFHRAWIYCGK